MDALSDSSSSQQSALVDPHWRPEYVGGELPEQLPQAPWSLLQEWLAQVGDRAGELSGEPGAVTLATVDAQGCPDARVVLLKDVSAAGFVFYTDSGSAKAQQLAANQNAAMVLYWPEFSWQVRCRGVVQKVSDRVADEYFAARPVPSQVAAHASAQSQQVASRQAVLDRFEQMTARFAGSTVVPPPASWVGYQLVPRTVELWLGDSRRLHDRVQFVAKQPSDLADESAWTSVRLQP